MGSPPACAKCKRGGAAEGDSWCSGCISLEGCTTTLKAFWWSASHRRLAETILVQAAQQLRAVKNLDTTLQSFNDSWESRLRKAGKGAGRPPEPSLPPRHPGGADSFEKGAGVAAEVKVEQRAPSPPVRRTPSGSPGEPSADFGEDTSRSVSRERQPEVESERPPPEVYPKWGGFKAIDKGPAEARDRSRSAVQRRTTGSRNRCFRGHVGYCPVAGSGSLGRAWSGSSRSAAGSPTSPENPGPCLGPWILWERVRWLLGAGQGSAGAWEDWAPTGRGKGKKGKKGKGKGKKNKAGKRGNEDAWWDNSAKETTKEGDGKKADHAK